MADNTRDIVIGLRTEMDAMKATVAKQDTKLDTIAEALSAIRSDLKAERGTRKGFLYGVSAASAAVGGTAGAFIDKIIGAVR